MSEPTPMMAEINQKSLPFARFLEQSQEFHKKAGPLKRRDILKITWTKDPDDRAIAGGVCRGPTSPAPSPMSIAIAALSSLYQKPAGGDFQIMRQERTFIDNDTAQKIELQRSRAACDVGQTGNLLPKLSAAERL